MWLIICSLNNWMSIDYYHIGLRTYITSFQWLKEQVTLSLQKRKLKFIRGPQTMARRPHADPKDIYWPAGYFTAICPACLGPIVRMCRKCDPPDSPPPLCLLTSLSIGSSNYGPWCHYCSDFFLTIVWLPMVWGTVSWSPFYKAWKLLGYTVQICYVPSFKDTKWGAGAIFNPSSNSNTHIILPVFRALHPFVISSQPIICKLLSLTLQIFPQFLL